MIDKEGIEKEIKKLEELRREWTIKNPSDLQVTDIYSDIEHFRNNTHEKFPNVNSFYVTLMQYDDAEFEDASDEFWAYLNSDKRDRQHLSNAIDKVHEGIDNLIEKLNQMKRPPL
jgi:hypothetical protein